MVDVSTGNLHSCLGLLQPRICHVLCMYLKQGRKYATLLYTFPNFEQVSCSYSGFNCSLLTRIWILQEAGQVVRYPHILKSLPQFFFAIYTIKCITVVNEIEVDVFLALSCLFHGPEKVGNLISGSFALEKPSLHFW